MKTIEQKLYSKKIKRPNYLIYNTLGYLWKYTIAKKYKTKVTFIDDPRKEKGSYILISNHASRLDYIYLGLPLLPHRLNFVVGYNEFFRSHLKGIFSILHEIPKKNFTKDPYPVLEMMRLAKKGGRLCILPEGMSSISGGSQPIATGGAKLLKMLKIPVYLAHIDGGYLISPKYNIKDRKGPVEVSFRKLYDVETLKSKSVGEIEDELNSLIRMDDYAFNKEKQYIYKSDEIAKNIHQLLYKCPFCQSEFETISGNDYIECKHCHTVVKMDNKYNLTCDKELPYKTPKEWYDYQRACVKEEIKNENFSMEEKMEIGFLPEYKYLKNQKTSNIEGEGILHIDHTGIDFKGKRNGKDFAFHLELKDVPTYGMCTDASRFYTFVDGKFVEFYPSRNSVIKWFLVTEELHRLHGGVWKDYKENR